MTSFKNMKLYNSLKVLFLLFIMLSVNISTAYAKLEEKQDDKEGLFALGLELGYSMGLNVNYFGLNQAFSRTSATVKNFSKTSDLDNGSSGYAPSALSIDLTLFAHYTIPKAEYLFVRVGFTYSTLISQTFEIKAKPVGLFTDGFNTGIAYSGYTLEIPFYVGFQLLFKQASTYIGTGIGYNYVSFSVREYGIRPGNQDAGDAGQILVATDEDVTNRFYGSNYSINMLLGAKYKVWSHLSVFIEVKYNLAGILVKIERPDTSPTEADLEGTIQAYKNAQRDSSTNYVVNEEVDADILAVLEGLNAFPYSPTSSTDVVISLIDQRYFRWNVGISYVF